MGAVVAELSLHSAEQAWQISADSLGVGQMLSEFGQMWAACSSLWADSANTELGADSGRAVFDQFLPESTKLGRI